MKRPVLSSTPNFLIDLVYSDYKKKKVDRWTYCEMAEKDNLINGKGI